MPPSSFTLAIRSLDRSVYELTAVQTLPLPPKKAFTFFEDPRNLFEITPDWLRFMMRDREQVTGMEEGAEFDHTIRWFGLPMRWKSRISGYLPPQRFTDIQVAGPYRSWSHLHILEEAAAGTLMTDVVTYRLPFGPLGRLAHALAVRRQLEDIFRYRAERIAAWAEGTIRWKTGHLAPAP